MTAQDDPFPTPTCCAPHPTCSGRSPTHSAAVACQPPGEVLNSTRDVAGHLPERMAQCGILPWWSRPKPCTLPLCCAHVATSSEEGQPCGTKKCRGRNRRWSALCMYQALRRKIHTAVSIRLCGNTHGVSVGVAPGGTSGVHLSGMSIPSSSAVLVLALAFVPQLG